ncbi:MAG: hypothetical protein O9284_11050 [Steroidobacteraceae bacterium]|jgi:NhaP-type Na+/H+ or K+/H+ antiporter|nr:hypothetical protein [Steroidobacteraceae bacterium]
MPSGFAFLPGGALLLAIAITSTALARVFVSSAMVYLAVGYLAGLGSAALLQSAPVNAPAMLELGAELALVISLFSVGLKMGSVLAPTDPVLASSVQSEGGREPERLRFGLADEGGLNYGTAFPIVMLGLGLLGLHDLGAGAWRWWALASGFLAVFAAGVALQRVPLHEDRRDARAAAASRCANAQLTDVVQTFNGQLEKVAELAMVLVVGWLLVPVRPSAGECLFALAVVCSCGRSQR